MAQGSELLCALLRRCLFLRLPMAAALAFVLCLALLSGRSVLGASATKENVAARLEGNGQIAELPRPGPPPGMLAARDEAFAGAGIKVVRSSDLPSLVSSAYEAKRKRRMLDLTRAPQKNGLQTLVNTWTEGSYSPVHRHDEFSETFVALDGALAFFVFSGDNEPTCHILSSDGPVRALVVEKGEWHAMTALPKRLGYPGHAVIFESSNHKFDPAVSSKLLAPFAPPGSGSDGDGAYFENTLLPLCASSAEKH